MSGILLADPGFGRGQTLGVTSTDQGTSVAGVQKVFTDVDPRTNNAGKHLSNRTVTCIAMRNISGSPIAGGTVVKFANADLLNSFDGAAPDANVMCGVVDEYLGAAGVANNDVCWIVVNGPVAATTQATLTAGAAVTVTTGEVAASAGPGDVVGIALSAPAGGKVRLLAGPSNGQTIAPFARLVTVPPLTSAKK